MATKWTIRVDTENASEAWWQAATIGDDMPAAVRRAIDDLGEAPIDITATDAVAAFAWARRLPGWDDGPAHARHPLLIEPATTWVDIWDAQTSDVLRVYDEHGDNMAEARMRQLEGGGWLYVDNVDGYDFLDDHQARDLMAYGPRVDCAYCGARVFGTGEEPTPAVGDNAWVELATEHADDCEWVRTRAHRVTAENK